MKDKQILLLNEAVKLVPFDGWSDITLKNATQNAGLEENYEKILFKNGPAEAATLFLRNIDKQAHENLSKEKLSNMKIRERIFYILESRFTLLNQQKAIIRKTVQFMSMPQNTCIATKLLWEMADNAWYASGDTSTDFNYYTKRTILMAIYSSSLLFWLNEDLEDIEQTKLFIKRRIDNVMQFESFKAKILQKINSQP